MSAHDLTITSHEPMSKLIIISGFKTGVQKAAGDVQSPHASFYTDYDKKVRREHGRRSPVFEQSVLWDLIVGHRFPEGVNLLKNELSDL